MTGKKPANEKLGVMTIGFSPVVREGLQAIMAKDENISVIGDARDGDEAVRKRRGWLKTSFRRLPFWC